MSGMGCGHARVLMREDHENRQMIASAQLPVKSEHGFMNKWSGKKLNPPQYCRLIQKRKAGDLLVVPWIDCLCRNYDAQLGQRRRIM